MDIVVCIKQVPDTSDVEIDKKSGTLKREGVPSIINPEDRNALEEALLLKEKYGGEIYAFSMGPPQAEEALVEAYAMGIDEVILLCDEAFAGSDTWATAYTLAQAIKELKNIDIVLCGRQAIDGDTGQVGPQLAENLGISQVTYVNGLKVEEDKVIARRKMEDGYMIVESRLPVLVTVMKDINEPRYPKMSRIIKANEKDIVKVWNKNDFKLEEENLGLNASPTQVEETYIPIHKREGEIFKGDCQQMVNELIERLENEKLI